MSVLPASAPPRTSAPPNEATLHEAALRHLARYSATEAGLLRVLGRRVDRWARAASLPPEVVALQAAAAKQAARAVVARLAASGAVNDALFAASRARSLHRAGRSRRAIAAHLQARGVDPALATPPDDPARELDAALLYAARRRMGPFRALPDPAQRAKDLGRLARAGFPAAIANQVLEIPAEQAEALLLQARRQ